MKPIAQTCLHLFFLLSLALTPMLMTSCGGDRYACDDCGDTTGGNPDETDAEDVAQILPLSFIEAANVTVDDVTKTKVFNNYDNIDYRFSTISEAREIKYNKDDDPANIAGISAEFWDDQIEALSWDITNSDLDDNRQRQYYRLDADGWKLITERNNHELRRYDEKVYDFWLGTTIKWEIYEAKDRLDPSGVAYPTIAGKHMDKVLFEFDPPLLDNQVALDGALLWGENIAFSDTTNAEAKIYVIYKQYRPITVKGDPDTTITEPSKNFYAFVPAPSLTTPEGTRFVFQPISGAIDPVTFIADFNGLAPKARFAINDKLFVSFNLSGAAGAGGEGVILWSSKTTEFPDGFADYYEVTTTNGSYIRIDIPMEQKATYKLETYENPLIAFIEDIEGDGANNGAHLGWYYVPSGTLEADKPQPHYAFNGAAVSDLKSAFDTWRRQQYCDDSEHNDDPGRTAVCSSIGL